MIFAFHVECMKDFVDIGLSVGIQKKYPLTTWAGKVFVEDRQPVTVPVLLTWFQGKSDLWLCLWCWKVALATGTLQSPGRQQRLWSTTLMEFQGPICFWPSLNVNGLLSSYSLILALLRSGRWTLHGILAILNYMPSRISLQSFQLPVNILWKISQLQHYPFLFF